MSRKLILILTFFVFSFGGCSKEEKWTQNIKGKYYGQMWSGGSELGCTTKFNVKDGIMSANYVMIEPYSAENGTVYDCKTLEEFKVHCKWKDRYGYGDVRLTFSKDYSTFKGHWNDEGKIFQHFKWRGFSDNAHIKQAEIVINKLNMQDLLDNLVIVHFREMVKIYPILKKHRDVFFSYYQKYLNLKMIKDDLISFCVTNFSTEELHNLIKNEKTRSIDIKNIEDVIKLQGLIIARSKANNNFNEFFANMEELSKEKVVK